MLEITCLNDDRCDLENFKHEHGLSLYINFNQNKFLFDVGQTDAFKENAIKLNLSISEIKYLILSHGHYDHTDGLKYLDDKVNIICHPDSIIWRKSKRTNTYNGIPYTKEELNEKFNMIMTKDVLELEKNIIYLGEIERKNDFECKKFPSILENGEDDTAPDDTGIAIKTDKGLVVISGCSHSGICNTIEHAKNIFKEENVYCVVGGFHLKESDEQTNKTIEYMKNNNIKRIILGHCTSDIVCDEFKKELSPMVEIEILKTGNKYII